MRPGNLIELTGLNADWEEIDTMMLYACFSLLERFVQEEMHLTDWEVSARQQQIKQEIDDLSTWWNQRKLAHQDLEDEEQQQEDTEMLLRLIQIRTYLWS
jgi:hypothetical protein